MSLSESPLLVVSLFGTDGGDSKYIYGLAPHLNYPLSIGAPGMYCFSSPFHLKTTDYPQIQRTPFPTPQAVGTVSQSSSTPRTASSTSTYDPPFLHTSNSALRAASLRRVRMARSQIERSTVVVVLRRIGDVLLGVGE